MRAIEQDVELGEFKWDCTLEHAHMEHRSGADENRIVRIIRHEFHAFTIDLWMSTTCEAFAATDDCWAVARERRHANQALASEVVGAFAAEHSGHYNGRMKGGNWKTISTERHFADRNVEVVTDRVQTPARSDPRAWTIVHRKAAVVVAPLTQDGKVVLIRQERIPIRQAIWEMPSGQIDDHDADEKEIRNVALREVREETGYELAPDGRLIPLGHYFSSPGFTDERGYLFLASPVQPCDEGPNREEAESILDCHEFSVEEIRRMIAENEIRDANTLGICATLAARGLLSLAPP